MHIPDGYVSGPINLAGGVAAATAVGLSAWRASRKVQEQPHTVPLLATTGAFVFAAQMLNFPIGVGTSGHFLGAAAVAALLGPWNACLVMTLVLTIQSLGFNDGGLTALGSNIFNMGVVGGMGGYLVLRGVRAVLPHGRAGFLMAAAVASWASVLMASGACALELAVSGTSPLGVVLPAMLAMHAVIGIGEGLITVAVLSAVIAARPDVVPEWASVGALGEGQPGKQRVRALAFAGLLTAVLLAMVVSPLASSSPDGLEAVAATSGFAEMANGRSVWSGSLLPDYSVPGVATEGMSTSLAGLLGTTAVFVAGFCVIRILGTRRAKQES